MEDFGARDSAPDDFCRENAWGCDVFVGIVGHLYGSSPPESQKSFTELEYDDAIQSKRPRLMFLAPENFPIPASLREDDQKSRQQEAFRARVNSDRVRASFRSPDDLAAGVVTALHNWERGHLVRDQVASSPEPADKLLERLNVQSFFVTYGDPPANFRAIDYIRMVAVPRFSNSIRLDRAAQERFEGLVRMSFREVHAFSSQFRAVSITRSRTTVRVALLLIACGAFGIRAPWVCAAFKGFSLGRTPFSRSVAILLVMRA